MKNENSIDALRDSLAFILSEAYAQGTDNPNVTFWNSALDAYDMIAGNEPSVIGVWGTPKMGKSTLLNSIVGESILPTGDSAPVTGCVVDLVIKPSEKRYRLEKKKGARIIESHIYSKAEDVRTYLTTHAGQDQPDESENVRIVVDGPFPKAKRIFGERGYILRDTPGAVSGEAMLEALNRDSQRTRAAMAEVNIPLFCVSGVALGQKADVEFYEKFFNHRLCMHVITHCDRDEDSGDEEDTTKRYVNGFYEQFNVVNDEVNPRIITCVGVDESQFQKKDRLLSFGLDALLAKVGKYFTRESLGETLRSIAEHIVKRSQQENGSWDNTCFDISIPVLRLETLKKQLQENPQ